jgi:hypothetical protein
MVNGKCGCCSVAGYELKRDNLDEYKMDKSWKEIIELK